MKEHREELPPLKFRALADALLDQIDTLVESWLSGGKREGHEWKCANLDGGAGRSCSVCMSGAKAGYWSDFNSDESGKDLLSLFAAKHRLTMVQATLQLARELGGCGEAGQRCGCGSTSQPTPGACTQASEG